MAPTMVERAAAYRLLTYYDTSIPPDLLPGGGGGTEPPPDEAAVLDALNPTSIAAGTPTDIAVMGSGFASMSKVWADEEQQITTFRAPTMLTYVAQADQAGTQTITVRHGELTSNAIELPVTAAEEDTPDEDTPDEEPPAEEPAPEPERPEGPGAATARKTPQRKNGTRKT